MDVRELSLADKYMFKNRKKETNKQKTLDTVPYFFSEFVPS